MVVYTGYVVFSVNRQRMVVFKTNGHTIGGIHSVHTLSRIYVCNRHRNIYSGYVIFMANRNKWWYSWLTEINGGIHGKQKNWHMNQKLLYSKQPDKYSLHMAKNLFAVCCLGKKTNTLKWYKSEIEKSLNIFFTK